MSKAKSLPRREEASEVAVEWVDKRNTRLGELGDPKTLVGCERTG